MHIDIQSRRFSLTQALRCHVERRLSFIGEGRYERIRRVMVRLSDINGPRGGNDKSCLIQVKLPGGADLVIEDTRSDLYSAIDRAAERVGHNLARKLSRKKRRVRRSDIRKYLLSSDAGSSELLPA